MICRHYLHFFSVRHAIIQNFQSSRAVFHLSAAYSLRVTAEVVAMTIILHIDGLGGGLGKKKNLPSCCVNSSGYLLHCRANNKARGFTLEGGIHFVIVRLQYKHQASSSSYGLK